MKQVTLRLVWPAVLTGALAFLAGCSSTTPAKPSESVPPSTPPSAADNSDEAHGLVLQAAGCWFGGLWSDGEGLAANERYFAGEKRCKALTQRLYGNAEKAKFDLLRVVDPAAVSELETQVAKLSASQPPTRKEALLKLFRAVAAAQREASDAHIAATVVKRDLENPVEPETLTKDEVAAVAPLQAHAALEALLKLDAGEFTAEAHTLGLLCAADRMEMSRSLPRHLKIYTVSDAFRLVFGATAPTVPSIATPRLKPGTWLNYLSDVARAAGHPVPAAATHPREREPWAWGGVFEGFADKLRADLGKFVPGSGLEKVTTTIVAKLDREWAEVPTIAASQEAMAEREAKERKK